MAKEMGVRTFCAPDSQVRKHLHDAHKILEMLGAPLVTFLALQELQLKTLARITEGVKQLEERRRRREERRKEIECGMDTHSGKSLKREQPWCSSEASRDGSHPQHSRMALGEEGDGKQHSRKRSNESKQEKPGTDVTENSRGGRLGLMISGDRYA